MRRDLINSLLAVIVFTLLCGVVYPLAATAIAQVVWPHKADGSLVQAGGRAVGSSLIGQSFERRTGGADPRYFQGRPSATGYSASVTYFNNLGPNSRELSDFFGDRIASYVERERPYNPGLGAGDVPVDAVTTSGSGVDPQISQANARVQARRVAAVRALSLARVDELIDSNTDGRAFGLFGEPGVNVLELNLALDREAPR